MKINISQKHGANIIEVKGDIDIYTSPKFREKLLNLIEKTKKAGEPIIVNLEKVDYMDSSGIATLVEALKILKDNNRKFALLKVNKDILEVLSLTKLDKVFQIIESVEELK